MPSPPPSPTLVVPAAIEPSVLSGKSPDAGTTAMSDGSSTTDPKKGRSRQRPGTACLGCRNRKLKCDGSQPRCEKCVRSGGQCIAPARTPRGPKKGYLRVLQNRIEVLEQQLSESQSQCAVDMDTSLGLHGESFDTTSTAVDSLFSLQDLYMPGDGLDEISLEPLAIGAPPITPATTTGETGSSSPMPLRLDSLDLQVENLLADDLLRSDLNQLYFERVQQSVPVLHRATYFLWAQSPTKTEAQVCLQYAMWTLAASLASQHRHVRDQLYRFTRLSLEMLECRDDPLTSMEHLQARLLLCIYELMRKNHQQAWMSAGRCFRLLQLMRLHDIDGPEVREQRRRGSSAEMWIHLEERRRTFWVAYALDMFISVRGTWSPTLHEHNITTLLPMPEEDFQNNNYVEMQPMTDPSAGLDPAQSSPFTDFVTLAFIIRHLCLHRQHSLAAGAEADPMATASFWARHNRLSEAIQARVALLVQRYPSGMCRADPVLLFTGMMLHAAVLCLGQIVEATHYVAGAPQPQQGGRGEDNSVGALRARSMQAAKHILELSRSLTQLSCFKIHPLTPLPLCICVEFMDAHRYLDDAADTHIQEIYNGLLEMSSVNHLAQDYLEQKLWPA